jgi:hypothetical protein
MRRAPLLRLRDWLHLVWKDKRHYAGVVLLLPALLLAGCARTGTAAQAQVARSDGTVSAGTRSAADGTMEAGRQEFIGAYLPLPFGFDIKASLNGDIGQFPIIIGPPAPAQAAPLAAPCAAPMFVQIEEEYEELVPVRRTRTRQVEVVPKPQAAPRCAPAPRAAPGRAPPVAQVSSCTECADGYCFVPATAVR